MLSGLIKTIFELIVYNKEQIKHERTAKGLLVPEAHSVTQILQMARFFKLYRFSVEFVYLFDINYTTKTNFKTERIQQTLRE